jgi:hypothetical protein
MSREAGVRLLTIVTCPGLYVVKEDWMQASLMPVAVAATLLAFAGATDDSYAKQKKTFGPQSGTCNCTCGLNEKQPWSTAEPKWGDR